MPNISGQDAHLPRSSSSYWANFFALGFFFAAIYFLHYFFPNLKSVWLMSFSLLAVLFPLVVYEILVLKVHRRESTGLADKLNAVDISRVLTKLLGLFGTFTIILVLYWYLPFFRKSFYIPFFDLLKIAGPFLVIICLVYFPIIDRRQVEPRDGYWQMGRLLLGKFKNVNWIMLREHFAVWFIKAFFTPIMIGALAGNIEELLAFKWQAQPKLFLSVYFFLVLISYTLDLIYGSLGYIFTCRIMDTHIRSTEPHFWGWLSCLACYYPFTIIDNYLVYSDGFYWMHWLSLSPWSYYFIGGTIIILSMVYGFATVALGYRMSNLTYRGIITDGPYRYTKHPAYICKVSSWWLIYLPFFSIHGSLVAFKYCMALGVISLIYYVRARTEENHLSNYPEYVEYAEWIKKHGAFRSVTRFFPSWQYSLEKCRKWNSVVWFKQNMSIVYLGFGSNLGDRHKNIKDAIVLLERSGVHIVRQSSLIETDPVGGPSQPKYINAAAKVETKLSPYELLNLIHSVEHDLGRERTIVNGPRTIDIDILLYDNIQIESEELTIPHPRMNERDFVLKPLKEIYK
ncbi:MAG: 2-amino-4-hydroxy-6-hydroxymethyldihydropteridine diphosphokinase [Candidatus Omnitrophica bacterium]|nr:2-amino-4-hydroxy-6-hydroxymethyldihydropteridine diphosphokinase [Candidatus Omnitrophota bacterium]